MTPSTDKCFCGKEAVGYIKNLSPYKFKRVCNAHWWSSAKQLDEWFERQYDRQWGDQEWYVNISVSGYLE